MREDKNVYKEIIEDYSKVIYRDKLIFGFGDIVVVDDVCIGVIVKSWENINHGKGFSHEVYVRSYNGIKEYPQDEIQRYEFDKEIPD